MRDGRFLHPCRSRSSPPLPASSPAPPAPHLMTRGLRYNSRTDASATGYFQRRAVLPAGQGTRQEYSARVSDSRESAVPDAPWSHKDVRLHPEPGCHHVLRSDGPADARCGRRCRCRCRIVGSEHSHRSASAGTVLPRRGKIQAHRLHELDPVPGVLHGSAAACCCCNALMFWGACAVIRYPRGS